MELVLGIDLGTSYFKLGLFDRSGEMRGLGRVSTPVQTPAEGFYELPVEAFWDTLREGLRLALQEARAKPGDIQAMAYSSQANTFVLLDAEDKPLSPLVLWTDNRGGVENFDKPLETLRDRSDFVAKTGLGIELGPTFAISKCRWFARNCPEIWQRVRRVMTISDYLTYSMTRRRVGDGGTASLLGIFDLPGGELWRDAIKTIELPESLFSQPLQPGSLAGKVISSGAETLGIPAGIPFVVGSLDHHIAAIGAGLGTTAEVSESTGTVLACLRSSEDFSPKPGCCMGPGTEQGYYQLAFSPHGASVLEWYQQQYASEFTVSQLAAQAELIPPGSDGLIVVPNANTLPGLEGFVNRQPNHTPGHFARAIMESVAAELHGLINTLCPDDKVEKIVATGGGARSDLWLQIKADLLGAEFIATGCDEPASLGSAMLAAVRAGWFENLHQAQAQWVKTNRTFTPTKSGQNEYAKWFENKIK